MDLAYSLDTIQLLTLAVGTVLPVLVGLVTTRVTHPGAKAVTLAFLSAVTALGTEALTAAQEAATYDIGRGLTMALGVWVVAVATHYGLWKPTGAAAVVADTGRTNIAPDTRVTD